MINKSTWIEQYLNGTSAISIAKTFNVTPRTVYVHLKKHNIKMRTFKATKMFNVPITEILAKFDSGYSVSRLAKEYDYSITGMSHVLKREGKLVIRPEDTNRSNWSFLYEDRNLFLYWLGWMLSDGCVYNNRQNGRSRGWKTYLTVTKSDKHILEFFRNIINKDRELWVRNNATRLDLSISKPNVDKLRDYGLVPAKSLILQPTDLLNELSREEFMQMLIGYIEGDGSISIKHIKRKKYVYPVLSIGISCGSKLWLEWINEKLISYNYKQRAISSKRTKKKFNGELVPEYISCYDYRVAGKEAVMLYDELIQCEHHRLSRKWDKGSAFKELL